MPPAWKDEGWTQDPDNHGRALCPACGDSVSKNAFARKAHKGSERCLAVASGTAARRKSEAREAKPPPPETFDCGKCGDAFPWEKRCREIVPIKKPELANPDMPYWCPGCTHSHMLEQYRNLTVEGPKGTKRTTYRRKK